MNPVILFRPSLAEEQEEKVARQYFPVYASRVEIPANSLVIGRYSVLPYYDELENDLKLRGSQLVNSYEQHRFIADVTNWSGPPEENGGLLGGLTPYTWTDWARLPEGSYVVKGKTNSRKQQWNTRMFAPTRKDIPKVASRLWDDALLADQGLVVRPYIPLVTFEEGLNGLPITNEWRTFWYCPEPGTPVYLAGGFYWATHPEVTDKAFRRTEQSEGAMMKVAREAAVLVSRHARFFAIDVAEKESGGWLVIEVNDGQMSGPALCLQTELYSNLSKALQCAS